MTVIVKLITEQSTNQLEASVNREQANGWFPVCGVVCFNARYTQLMAIDSNATEVPKCNYFIVDSENGIDFTEKVNALLDLNPGAVCLSSVQYVQARYIQAYGDDSLHNGGGNIPPALDWYQEDVLAGATVPAIRTNPRLPYVTVDGSDTGMGVIAIVTDYGQGVSDMTLPLQLSGVGSATQPYQWQITGDQVHTGQIVAQDGYMMMQCGGEDMNRPQLVMLSGTASQPKVIHLVAGSAGLTLTNMDKNELVTPTGQEFVIRSGNNNAVQVLPASLTLTAPVVGSTNTVISAAGTSINAGSTSLGVAKDGAITAIVNTSYEVNYRGEKLIEADATAVRLRRGKGSLNVTDSGGSCGYNSMLRMAWDTNGWNVSQDTFVAFSSRPTYSVMLGPNDARVEANDTGIMLISNAYNSAKTTLNMVNGLMVANTGNTTSTMTDAGFTNETHGEYAYSIDDKLVFFSSGDITRINTETMGVALDDGAGISITSASNHPVVIGGGPVLPTGTTQLGTAENPWPNLYLNGSSQRVVQTSTASAAVPAATIAKMATLIPKALNTSNNDFSTGYTYDDVITAFGAGDATQYGLAWMEGTTRVVNPDAIQAMDALYRRSIQTREAVAESQERICGLVPGNGLNANHPLGDSGYAIRVTGKTNGDFDLYLADSTPGRNVTYLYRKQTGTGIFEENSSQSATSTAALKLNTTDVNNTANVEVRLYISDITTGRGWAVRIWPQNRSNRRYNMSIFEMTEGDTPTYRDYSL